MRATSLIALCFLMQAAGCASTRVYPLCHFDESAPGQFAKRADVLAFADAIAGERGAASLSPNERFVSVHALPWRHERLALVWPRAACIGVSRYDEEYYRYKGCVRMIEAGLQRKGIPPLGEFSDSIEKESVFYCGVPLE